MKKILSVLALTLFLTSCETSLFNPTIDYPVSTSSISAVLVIIEESYAGNNPGAQKDLEMMKDLISDVTDDIVILKDSYATRRNVKEAITRACSNELAIIFFSCHGGHEKAAKADRDFEKDGYDEFVYLSESTITDNELWKIFSTSTNRVFTIFNCCNSGTMFRATQNPNEDNSLKCNSSYCKSQFQPFSSIPSNNENKFTLLSWSACKDGYSAVTSSEGGEFVKTIYKTVNSFKRSVSYNDAWTVIRYSSDLNFYQKAELNCIGDYEDFEDKIIFR